MTVCRTLRPPQFRAVRGRSSFLSLCHPIFAPFAASAARTSRPNFGSALADSASLVPQSSVLSIAHRPRRLASPFRSPIAVGPRTAAHLVLPLSDHAAPASRARCRLGRCVGALSTAQAESFGSSDDWLSRSRTPTLTPRAASAQTIYDVINATTSVAGVFCACDVAMAKLKQRSPYHLGGECGCDGLGDVPRDDGLGVERDDADADPVLVLEQLPRNVHGLGDSVIADRFGHHSLCVPSAASVLPTRSMPFERALTKLWTLLTRDQITASVPTRPRRARAPARTRTTISADRRLSCRKRSPTAERSRATS